MWKAYSGSRNGSLNVNIKSSPTYWLSNVIYVSCLICFRIYIYKGECSLHIECHVSTKETRARHVSAQGIAFGNIENTLGCLSLGVVTARSEKKTIIYLTPFKTLTVFLCPPTHVISILTWPRFHGINEIWIDISFFFFFFELI